jgi:nicotinamide-nucleotide amidase
MTCEIISIGTELLLGQIVDSNAAFLSHQLAAIGVQVLWRTTVGDNRERIAAALRNALSRADVVITIGGLGPTEDDLTREAIAEVLGEPLEYDDELGEHLKQLFAARGREATPAQLRQAYRPPSATPIPNPYGTAPGLRITRAEFFSLSESNLPSGRDLEKKILDKQWLFALPGPPNEFEPMVREQVIPALAPLAKGMVIRSRVLRLCGIGEADAEAQVQDLVRSPNPTLAPLAKLGEVHLRITARAASPDEAEQMIALMERTLRERLGAYIYGTDDTTLEQVVVNLLREYGQSLATAESCTGGLLSHRVTDVPGSSDVFIGGIVAYSNAVKQQELGVPHEVLAEYGAVSEPTARAMAEGVRTRLGSHWGIGITGIAGPTGGTPEKPVGLVYIGLSDPTGTLVTRHLLLGDRQTVKWRASQVALTLLWRGILKGGCASLSQS